MIKFTTVKKGSCGFSAAALQLVLRIMQYTGENGEPIEIDGHCGPVTEYAINEFQKRQIAYGAPECGTNGQPDGSFGPACWARLTGTGKSNA